MDFIIEWWINSDIVCITTTEAFKMISNYVIRTQSTQSGIVNAACKNENAIW